MKKLVLFVILVVATISFTFAQSSREIYNDWQKARKKIERKNDDPKNIQIELDKIDSTYISFYRLALENERSSTTTQPNSTPTNTSGSSTPAPRNLGANVSLPGFQGGSYNIKDAAVAYATVVTTDANAYYTKTIADNYNKSQNGGEGGSSFKCLLRNEDNSTVIFTITGINGMFIIRPTVPGGGSVEVELPPGTYKITTTLVRALYTESKPVTREVGNPTVYSLWEGKKYCFVLTQPRS